MKEVQTFQQAKLEVLQSKFLRFVWLMSARDWTNEVVIAGIILLAAMDIYVNRASGTASLAYALGGGLVGYLVKGDPPQIPEISS